jgi:hypothetical protein
MTSGAYFTVEHALDLIHTLLNLQDHFDLEGFEGLWQAMLVVMIVAVSDSEGVGPCIITTVLGSAWAC